MIECVTSAFDKCMFALSLGLCIRSEEITLLVGSHGPTMNVYIAKMTVPAPCTATIPIVPWPATTDRTGGKTSILTQQTK